MEHSGSQQGATPGTLRGSSPAPNMMGTPSLSQNTGFGAMTGSPAPGSVGMARGPSSFTNGLGIHGADALGMPSDRELVFKNKVREITEMLKDEWGYVSRAGVVRAAERLQLDVMWESVETADPGVLSVGGEGLIVTMNFESWKVTSLTLGLASRDPSTSEADKEAEEKRGAEILLKDLQGWDGERETGQYVSLKRFGQNMEYLATIDKYGKGGVSCLRALDGIYRSLLRVQSWWERRTDAPQKPPLIMLTNGCGWPRMHANGTVGLCLDYWLAQHASKRVGYTETYLSSPVDREPDLYSLRIGVGPVDPAMSIQPIRVSSEWFEFLDDMPVDSGLTLPMGLSFVPLELKARYPDATFLPGTTEPGEGDMELDGAQTQKMLPNVLFKACFDPPIPMGWVAAEQLLQGRLTFDAQMSIGNNCAHYGNFVLPESFTKVALGSSANGNSQGGKLNQQTDTLPMSLSVPTTHIKSESERCHFSLSGLSGPDTIAVMVHEFAFGHPMELLEALPSLRMWAWLHGTFKQSFSHSDKPQDVSEVASKKSALSRVEKLSPKEYRRRLKAGLPIPPQNESMVKEEKTDDTASKPDPSEVVEIQLGFDNMIFGRILLDIKIGLPGGEDPVIAQLAIRHGPEITPRDASAGDKFAEAMAKVLLATEDFGVLVKWVRDRKAKEAEKEKAQQADKEQARQARQAENDETV